MSAAKIVASVVNSALRPLGLSLERRGTRPSLEAGLRLLGANGFTPRTVFDVGIAEGTPALYRVFPDAEYHLIDPLREALPHMQRIATQLRASVHNVALGEREETLTIDVRRSIGGSTLFREVGPADSVASYPVPVRRFDALFPTFVRPALCKIDVQGAELMVLRGMGELVGQIDAFLIESSLIETLEGGAHVYDVIDLLRARGVVLYDVCGLGRRPLDGALTQVDLLFVRKDLPLLRDHRWSATA